jgi:hypothetical protein
MVPHLFGVIGSDRCVTMAEAESAAEGHPLTATAWDIYDRHFRCFTGATIDPQFHYLSHPATRTGAVRVDADETVMIVDAGPSLLDQIDVLFGVSEHVRIFASLRGAKVLLGRGIVPDLVLLDHRAALDAQVLARCPLVAAGWRTPPALASSVAPAALFVPSAQPAWGLWAAMAAALAVDAGASTVALLGVDAGTAAAPDPLEAPLQALLELLARLVSAATFDCGVGGAITRGWTPMRLHDIGGARVGTRLETDVYLAPHREQRLRDARAALAELAPLVDRATALETLALRARSHRGRWTHALEAGIDEIMDWHRDSRIRVLLQESIGAAFLPRLWRIGIARGLGARLWRPLLLATHELTAQARALSSHVAEEEAAA